MFFNISRYWKTIQSYFSSLFQWGGLDEVMAEEMTVLPGMDELGNLLWIGDHVDEGQLRPDRGRRRADRRDGAPAQPAGGESLVDRAHRADRPSRSAARWSAAPAGRRRPATLGVGLRGRGGAARAGCAMCTTCSRIRTARPSGSCSTSSACRSRRRSARSPTSTCTASRPT